MSARYEHNVFHVNGHKGPAGLCQGLDELTSKGWEVLSIERIPIIVGSQIVVPGQQQGQGQSGWEVVVRRCVDAPPCTCEQSLPMG